MGGGRTQTPSGSQKWSLIGLARAGRALMLAKFSHCARMSQLRLSALLDIRFDLDQPFAPVMKSDLFGFVT
jgi:hypothetical protein